MSTDHSMGSHAGPSVFQRAAGRMIRKIRHRNSEMLYLDDPSTRFARRGPPHASGDRCNDGPEQPIDRFRGVEYAGDVGVEHHGDDTAGHAGREPIGLSMATVEVVLGERRLSCW